MDKSSQLKVEEQCYEESLNYAYPERMTDEAIITKLQEHGIDNSLLESIKEDSVELQRLFYSHLAALPRRNPRSNRRGQRIVQSRLMEPKVKIFSANKNTVNTSSTQKHKSSSAPMSEMDKLLNRSKLAKTENGTSTTKASEMDRLLSRNRIPTSKGNSETVQAVSFGQPSSSNTVTVMSSSLSEMDKLEARSKMMKIRCKTEDNVPINSSPPLEPSF